MFPGGFAANVSGGFLQVLHHPVIFGIIAQIRESLSTGTLLKNDRYTTEKHDVLIKKPVLK